MLIVDMPMPKFCIWCDDKNEPHQCPLLNEDDDCVLQESNIFMGWNEQYAHCPIKGVLPEEHGDLIDRDVSIQTFKCIEEAPYSGFDGQEAFYTPEDVVNTLLCQDVVIAAERKDDE